MSNLPEIPAGWAKCGEWEATHGLLATGEIKEIAENFQGVNVNGFKIYIEAWTELGITPILKPKVEPIEFRVERIEIASGRLCLLISVEGTQLDRPTADRMIGKTFREVVE